MPPVTAMAPGEMLLKPESVTIVFFPAMAQASWAEIESFGTSVRNEIDQRNQPACLIDLSAMSYMGSSVVALMIRIWKSIQSKKGRMVVVCPHPLVLEVLQLAGLDRIWTIVESGQAAEKLIKGRSSVAVGSPSPRRSSKTIVRLKYFALGAVTMLAALAAILMFVIKR